MSAQTLIVSLLLGADCVFALHLCGYLASKARGLRSALFLALIMAASAWWALFNALEYMAAGLDAKIVFANLQYLAIVAIPVLWYAFGLSLVGDEIKKHRRLRSIAFWIIPAATAALVWLDPSIGLVRTSFALEVRDGMTVLAKGFGPWFWLHSAYSYALMIAGTVRILGRPGSRRGMSLGRRVVLAAAALLPAGLNLLYLGGLLPLPSVDPTPFAFPVAGMFIVLMLTRFRFFTLVDAARKSAMENLRDALLVVDRDGSLAYANATARSVFGVGGRWIGRPLSLLGPPLGSLSDMTAGEERELLVAVGVAEGRRFEVRASGLGKGGLEGPLVMTLYDITRRAVAEEALKEANISLEGRIDERTRALEETNLRLSQEIEHRIRTERQLTHDALHDPLTGLANRSLVLNRIEQAINRLHRDPQTGYGILYLDFDDFKAVNDTYGHEAGDHFLRETAIRLKRCVREVDTIARIGGDEFVVLLETSGVGAGLEGVAERISEELSVPLSLGRGSVVPSASIGMLSGKAEYTNAADTLHWADIAMYSAKSTGRSQRVLFEESLLIQTEERNKLASELRAAIASGGLGLAFQPIVCKNGAIEGWEVLARWKHGKRGHIGPDRFIPLAEEMGLIVPLGTFVLYETLKTAAALRDAGLIDPNSPRGGEPGPEGKPYFSVNVAAEQLYAQDFAEIVLSAIDRSGLPRSILHLELTESTIIENRSSVTSVLKRLSKAGISFKLDDFGTGYSSLDYLHRMPIESVKIDRSFVARMRESRGDDVASEGILRGIISLSHELGKRVVAEGVETEFQANMLHSFGCDHFQGWYYGRPMDGGALHDSLSPARATAASDRSPRGEGTKARRAGQGKTRGDR
jgi:diguanylate cyclase (GGDEF)-like protein